MCDLTNTEEMYTDEEYDYMSKYDIENLNIEEETINEKIIIIKESFCDIFNEFYLNDYFDNYVDYLDHVEYKLGITADQYTKSAIKITMDYEKILNLHKREELRKLLCDDVVDLILTF